MSADSPDARFAALDRLIEERSKLTEARFLAMKELVDERDRLYGQRFEAVHQATAAALVAQKESTAAAFAASDKAITKAEEAQREYNVRSNEFRGQLDDQAKTLMPRPEVSVLFNQLADRVEALRMDTDRRVNELRDSRKEKEGVAQGGHQAWGYFVGAAGLILTIITVSIMILSKVAR